MGAVTRQFFSQDALLNVCRRGVAPRPIQRRQRKSASRAIANPHVIRIIARLAEARAGEGGRSHEGAPEEARGRRRTWSRQGIGFRVGLLKTLVQIKMQSLKTTKWRDGGRRSNGTGRGTMPGITGRRSRRRRGPRKHYNGSEQMLTRWIDGADRRAQMCAEKDT